MRISVVIPAYNEAVALKDVLPRVFAVVGSDAEVIVVDDASTDDTAGVAQACGARVVVNPYNMGNGAAVKRGLRAARGDVVVLMDADGQHVAEEIPKLLAPLEKFDMVIGARVSAKQAWWRKCANSVFNTLAQYVTGTKILDLTSGFRAVKRDKALAFVHLLPNTFSYPSTITLSFIKAAYPVTFVPVTVRVRQSGKSNIRLWEDGSRFFFIIMKITVLFSPLKVFLPVSSSFLVTGIVYYVYTFIRYHRFTNMSALLLTTAVIIFMLGLVSEQIALLKAGQRDT